MHLLEIEICESSSSGSPFNVHVTVGIGLPEISHDSSVSPCSSTSVRLGSFSITGNSAKSKYPEIIIYFAAARRSICLHQVVCIFRWIQSSEYGRCLNNFTLTLHMQQHLVPQHRRNAIADFAHVLAGVFRHNISQMQATWQELRSVFGQGLRVSHLVPRYTRRWLANGHTLDGHVWTWISTHIGLSASSHSNNL